MQAYNVGDRDTFQNISRADEADLTSSDSESEYIPSETSEDRNFIVSDTEQVSERFFDSDQSSNVEDDIESLCEVSITSFMKLILHSLIKSSSRVSKQGRRY